MSTVRTRRLHQEHDHQAPRRWTAPSSSSLGGRWPDAPCLSISLLSPVRSACLISLVFLNRSATWFDDPDCSKTRQTRVALELLSKYTTSPATTPPSSKARLGSGACRRRVRPAMIPGPWSPVETRWTRWTASFPRHRRDMDKPFLMSVGEGVLHHYRTWNSCDRERVGAEPT